MPAPYPFGPETQCGQLVRLLKRSGWISTAEILREVPCVVHSRMSDLRFGGYEVQHRTVGKGAKGSQWRLVSAPSERGDSPVGTLTRGRQEHVGNPRSLGALSEEEGHPDSSPAGDGVTAAPPSSESVIQLNEWQQERLAV